MNFMRRRNLIFPLVVGSLFMPSIEALVRTTNLTSLENENNLYEAVDIYIAGNTGGGGSHSHNMSANFSGTAVTPTANFSGSATSVVQPYVAVKYMIKT